MNIDERSSEDETLDDLYLQLDRAVFGDAENVFPHKIRDAIARGRRLFDEWLEVNRDRFCNDARIKSINTDSALDSAADIAVIIDVITAIAGALPVATVVAIVVRRGLRVVCPT